MKNISEINTLMEEGRMLMAALAILTVSPKLLIGKQEVNGQLYTPYGMLDVLDKASQEMFSDSIPSLQEVEQPPVEFEKAISDVINKYSRENDSNTPDFILARYLTLCLFAFNEQTRAREKWYGKTLSIN